MWWETGTKRVQAVKKSTFQKQCKRKTDEQNLTAISLRQDLSLSLEVQTAGSAGHSATTPTESDGALFLSVGLGRLQRQRFVLFSFGRLGQIRRQMKLFHGESFSPQFEGEVEGGRREAGQRIESWEFDDLE